MDQLPERGIDLPHFLRLEWGKAPSGDGPYHSVVKRTDRFSQEIYQNLLRKLSAAVERYELVNPMITGRTLAAKDNQGLQREYYLVTWSESVLPPNTRSFLRTRALVAPLDDLRQHGLDARDLIALGRWQTPGWSELEEAIIPVPLDAGSSDREPPGRRQPGSDHASGGSSAVPAASEGESVAQDLTIGEALQLLWARFERLSPEDRLHFTFAVGVPGRDVALPFRPAFVLYAAAEDHGVPVLRRGLTGRELGRALLEIVTEHPGLPELWQLALFREAADLASDGAYEGERTRSLGRIHRLLDAADVRDWVQALPPLPPGSGATSSDSGGSGGQRLSRGWTPGAVDLAGSSLQTQVISLITGLESQVRSAGSDLRSVLWCDAILQRALDLLDHTTSAADDVDGVEIRRGRLLGSLRLGLEYFSRDSQLRSLLQTANDQIAAVHAFGEEIRRREEQKQRTEEQIRKWGSHSAGDDSHGRTSPSALVAQGFLTCAVMMSLAGFLIWYFMLRPQLAAAQRTNTAAPAVSSSALVHSGRR